MTLGDRFSSLSRSEIAGVVVLLAVTLGGAGLWYSRSLPRPVSVAETTAPSVVAPAANASASPSTAVILVDVAGWVRHPGVYEFHEGDRVVDAVEAAGGARPGADLTALNLAAPLTDGSQILVAKAGEVPGTATGGGSTTGAPGGGTLININTATELELENLPGVGPVLGAAIVAYRTENGSFASIEDLLNVSGIGPATLEEIRAMATV